MSPICEVKSAWIETGGWEEREPSRDYEEDFESKCTRTDTMLPRLGVCTEDSVVGSFGLLLQLCI